MFATSPIPRWFVGLLCLLPGIPCLFAGHLECTPAEVPLRYVRYEFAVETDPRGLPVMDWKRFRSVPEQVVTRSRRALVLENDYLKATLIPSMGAVHSWFIRLLAGEQLWISPIAIPWVQTTTPGFG